MSFNTVNVRGRELSPFNRQAAIVTSIYDDGSYSLDLTSKELSNDEYEKVILEEPLEPYAIKPKVKSFIDLTGETNNKLEVVGFLGFKYNRCFWMIRCFNCGKYSIREHNTWLERVKKTRRDFCYHCDDIEEITTSKMIKDFEEKHVKKVKEKVKVKEKGITLKLSKVKLVERLAKESKRIKRELPPKLAIVSEMAKMFANYNIKTDCFDN